VIGKVFHVHTDTRSDPGKPKGTEVPGWGPPSGPARGEQYDSSCDDVQPCVARGWAQGVFFHRGSFERGIAVRFKEMEIILLFHGFSKLSFLSAAGMKLGLP